MYEQETVVRVGLSLEVRVEDIPVLIGYLGAVAVDRVRIGEQHLAFLEDMEKDQMMERVGIQSVRNFYHRYFQDETPSAIATVLAHRVLSGIPEDKKYLDKKGEAFEADRQAWDTEVQNILKGKSKTVFRKSTKQRKLLEDFQSYLPKTD
jgi:hypothetical protein